MAYLFTHFTSDAEQDKEHIWFAVSRDGLFWQDLGSDEPVITSKVSTTGIRDPFVVYDEKMKKYFIIATDLCTTKGGNWYDYSHKGSRNILISESEDLISWSAPRMVEAGIPSAGCVWAPEAVYCKEKESWLVFWASNVREGLELCRKQRIYASYTKDFTEFTPAFKFMEKKTALIDTNIISHNGWYYRFTKDETNKRIILDRCRTLVPEKGEEYEPVHSDYFASHSGLEGPECYRLPDGRLCLIVDRYREGKGYIPVVCDDPSTGAYSELPVGSFDMGKRKKRHGGVIEITDEQMDLLIKHYSV